MTMTNDVRGRTDGPDAFRVRLKVLNPHITCALCKGYFIDATTILDCLHTFCKSCLLRHFESGENTCPTCQIVIHQSHPSHYVSYDRTMQALVYKLVPGLHEEEIRRREQYHRLHGGEVTSNGNDSGHMHKNESMTNVVDGDCHRTEEHILVRLTSDGSLVQLRRHWYQLSVFATVAQLKRLIAQMVWNDRHALNEIDILCNDELMGKDHTLKFIQKTRWRDKPEPLCLNYRRSIDY